MLPHLDVPISREADVSEARAAVAAVAARHGIDETIKGRVALVATELGINLLRHARDGRLLIGCHAVDDGATIEVIAIDSGPGMPDINRNMRDRRHSGASPGGGLAGVRHLSTDFSIFSVPGRGTVVVSRAWAPAAHAPNSKSPSARFSHAGICLAALGQSVSGDAWAIRLGDCKASVIVSDGTGKGVAASDASAVATSSFHEFPAEPHVVLQRTHALLTATAGAAVAIADLDARAGTMAFSGAGNVACRIVSSTEDIVLSSQPGILGRAVDEPVEVRRTWPDHSVIIMHSDGLSSEWHLKSTPGLLHCDPAVIGGWLLRDHASRVDDVTIIVLKRN